MANEIWAALIQAVPIAVAAGVGWRGLNTWRTQLREGRQVGHAEQALAAAAPMFRAVRAARSPNFSLQEYLAPGKEGERSSTTIELIQDERLARAWGAWRRFQGPYELARLYFEPTKARPPEIAHEIASCISDLDDNALRMRLSNPGDEEHVRAWHALRGSSDPSVPDSIERRLRTAEQALQAELGPILLAELRGPMNVRRGLFRLWAVCSIAWIAFVGFDAINYGQWDWEASIPPRLEWAFGVPLAAALVLLAAYWAGAGFAKPKPQGRP